MLIKYKNIKYLGVCGALLLLLSAPVYAEKPLNLAALEKELQAAVPNAAVASVERTVRRNANNNTTTVNNNISSAPVMRTQEMVEVAVPVRRLMRGEVISDADLDYIEVAAVRVNSMVLTDASEMVGMEARRPIPAGQPVRLSQVQTPRLVQKGDLLTLVVQAPGMTLTAQGKALQDGGKGDVVRAINNNSKKVVEAVVVGSQLAEVRIAPMIPALQNAQR